MYMVLYIYKYIYKFYLLCKIYNIYSLVNSSIFDSWGHRTYRVSYVGHLRYQIYNHKQAETSCQVRGQ